jgi:hypothetical protein
VKKYLHHFTKSSTSTELRTRLLQWNHTSDREWKAYYNPTHTTTTIRRPNSRHVKKIQGKKRRYWHTRGEGTISQTFDTTGLFPATTIGKNKVLAFEQQKETQTTSTSIQTWRQFVQELPSWERDLLTKTKIANATDLRDTLNNSGATLYLVSDGGAKDTRGSYGWVISDNNINYASGCGPARGNNISSFRAESYGCLSVHRFLIWYCQFNKINPI